MLFIPFYSTTEEIAGLLRFMFDVLLSIPEIGLGTRLETAYLFHYTHSDFYPHLMHHIQHISRNLSLSFSLRFFLVLYINIVIKNILKNKL